MTEKEKEKEFHITLVDKSYVKPRGRGGEPYGEYVKGIKDNDILSWIQEEISHSEDGRIIALLSDFAEAIDMKIKTTKYSKGKKPHSIYWGAKYALYILGNYIVNLGTSIHDEPLLIIHEAPEDYELPTSLLKKIEQEMEEEEIDDIEEGQKKEEEKGKEKEEEKTEEKGKEKEEEKTEEKGKEKEEEKTEEKGKEKEDNIEKTEKTEEKEKKESTDGKRLITAKRTSEK